MARTPWNVGITLCEPSEKITMLYCSRASSGDAVLQTFSQNGFRLKLRSMRVALLAASARPGPPLRWLRDLLVLGVAHLCLVIVSHASLHVLNALHQDAQIRQLLAHGHQPVVVEVPADHRGAVRRRAVVIIVAHLWVDLCHGVLAKGVLVRVAGRHLERHLAAEARPPHALTLHQAALAVARHHERHKHERVCHNRRAQQNPRLERLCPVDLRGEE
mmetsp:Transcript_18978/g.48713  ORF Transcript_18978/g.48713 Transcript_18978/m.48713 type:complete len:217 (-) Transcript_18978:936-1586(-)